MLTIVDYCQQDIRDEIVNELPVLQVILLLLRYYQKMPRVARILDKVFQDRRGTPI